AKRNVEKDLLDNAPEKQSGDRKQQYPDPDLSIILSFGELDFVHYESLLNIRNKSNSRWFS
ncbi:MAG: hypothetical protein AAF696_39215, partial [Bacteroidota bacterium]